MKLLHCATVASLQHAVFTTVPSGHSFYHRVRKGETLASIAARYDVTAQDLKAWNKSAGSSLVAGQKLRVVSDMGPVGAKKSKQSHQGSKPSGKSATSPKSAKTSAPSGRPSPRAVTKP